MPESLRSGTVRKPRVVARVLAGNGSWELLRVGAILAVAVAVGLFEIGQKSLWYDEAFSALAAERPWGDLLGLLQSSEVNMALYYALLHVWLTLGTDEAHIRMLSAGFAVGAVAVTYLLGRRLFKPSVGQLAALLLAVNAFAVQYAQEARSYSLLLFLAAASTYALIQALDRPTLPRWIAYALLAAALPYAHLLGIAMWVVHAIAIAVSRPLPPRRLLAVAVVTCGAVVAPLAWVATTHAAQGITWVPFPTLRLVAESWISLAGSGVPGGVITPVGIALTAAVTMLAVLGAAVQLARRDGQRWVGAVIVVWLWHRS